MSLLVHTCRVDASRVVPLTPTPSDMAITALGVVMDTSRALSPSLAKVVGAIGLLGCRLEASASYGEGPISGVSPAGSAERRGIASFWQGLGIGEDGGTTVQ